MSLDTLWNLNYSQILLQNLLSKNYWWKNTLSLSKVIIMRLKLSLRSPLEVWRWHHFSIFKDNIKNRFVVYSTISHYSQTASKVSSVKSQHRWNNLKTIISSWKYVHFSNNLFFWKLLYITRFFQRQPEENCANFLVRDLEGIFLRFC